MEASFSYRADGLMTAAGGSTFGYANNGLLIGRTNSARTYTIGQRDGRGRVLQTTTTAGSATVLAETLNWRNDGRLNSCTEAGGDFTDNRAYSYSPLAQRLIQESLDVAAGQSITNDYSFDFGQAAGVGVLTSQAETGGTSATWSVPNGWPPGMDSLYRITEAQNSVISRSAFGLAKGAGFVSAILDGRPLSVQFDGPEGTGQWRADIGLSSGPHTLAVSAMDPSGLYFASTNTSFASATNAGDGIATLYDGEGSITQQMWVNVLGQTNRIKSLTWDAFDRLIGVVDRDASSNGFNWTAVYDGLGRRVSTIYTMVISNMPVENLNSANAVSEIDSFYDPQVEFLEVGVAVNGEFTMKTYGPDANGIYGGMQGVGGLEYITLDGHSTVTGIVQDYFGNVLGFASDGTVTWNPTRLSSYGPVPGYESPALSLDVGVEQSLGWRGKRVDETGLVYLGARLYDPVAGRFMSADPLGHSASQDLYSFCGGDPVNRFDSDGRIVLQQWQQAQQNLIISGGFWNNAMAVCGMTP